MSIKEVMASDEVDERSTTVVMKGLRNSTRVFKNSVTMKMNELEAEGLAWYGFWCNGTICKWTTNEKYVATKR